MTFKYVDLEIPTLLFFKTEGEEAVIEDHSCNLIITCVNTYKQVINNLLGEFWGMPNGIN